MMMPSVCINILNISPVSSHRTVKFTAVSCICFIFLVFTVLFTIVLHTYGNVFFFLFRVYFTHLKEIIYLLTYLFIWLNLILRLHFQFVVLC